MDSDVGSSPVEVGPLAVVKFVVSSESAFRSARNCFHSSAAISSRDDEPVGAAVPWATSRPACGGGRVTGSSEVPLSFPGGAFWEDHSQPMEGTLKVVGNTETEKGFKQRE